MAACMSLSMAGRTCDTRRRNGSRLRRLTCSGALAGCRPRACRLLEYCLAFQPLTECASNLLRIRNAVTEAQRLHPLDEVSARPERRGRSDDAEPNPGLHSVGGRRGAVPAPDACPASALVRRDAAR